MNNLKKERKTHFLIIIFGFVLSFHLLATGQVFAAINTDTAITPAKGETIIRSLLRVQQNSGDVSGENKKRTVFLNKNVFIHGLTDATALFVTAPFVYKELEVNDLSGGRTDRTGEGLGDMRFFLKQRLWKKDAPGATTRVSILGGVETPTGESSETDELGKLPKSVQPGSGSWDPFSGVVFTHQEHRYEFSQDLVYLFNTQKGNFEFGDVLTHNTGFWYRFWPTELPEKGVPSQFHAVLELNGVWRQKNELDGQRLDGSGGYTLYVSPGIQWVGNWWIVEGSIQFPVVDNLGSQQLENDPAFIFGFRVAF